MSTIKSPPRPMHYFFRCATCDTYLVSEETAKKFLTSRLQKRLDESIREGAHGAILTFHNGCPNCTPDNKAAEIKLSALMPKIN
ncbi:MAG: hypothetical protein KBD50_01710 [Candidatus Pacebacteria bacterium]|nr:hypothetical protein [Candidatus Paceibacterota bacterium]